MEDLKPCPFCGGHPHYIEAEWKDENRYVQAGLECCITMTASIGWMRARGMTSTQENKELKQRLHDQWNSRHEINDGEQQD